jgi:hypothetical protein
MSALTVHVAVQDDDGATHSFGPDSEVPEWAQRKITNPKVWEDGDVPFPADGADDGEGSDGPPPKAGRGSSEDKWRSYAADKGVDVSDATSRDEVIAKLEAAGVPVE